VNDILPDPQDAQDLSTFAKSYNSLYRNEEDEYEMNFLLQMMLSQMEQAYIMGRTTKEQLIMGLSKLFQNESGLDFAELVEEIEQSKENFYKEITERVRRELRSDKTV
jgi:CRISPR/Cas system CMR subunit Cmr6 (Cas7 group RAMP superfamily)